MRAAALCLLLCAFSGCESPIPRIDPLEARFAGLGPERLAQLEAGRTEYVAKCSGCHPLYAPRRGDALYWDLWVKAMASRSGLTPAERERIGGYLRALGGR